MPALDWGACPAGSRGGRSAAAVRCGWLRTGARLAGQPVRLRVAILQARPDRRDPTPIVYLPGGPGEPAGLDGAALRAWRAFQQHAGWAHDIVLFDPRGTGASRPRPRCLRPARRRFSPVSRARTGAPGASSADRAAAACYARLGPGVARALGPDAQLADLDALVAALGVRRINLWSVSYATRLALLYAYRRPRRVHALVADSLIPFGFDARAALPAQIRATLARLSADCAARPRCARSGAAPRATVYSLLKRYAKRAPTLTGGKAKKDQPLVITPYRLLLMLLYAGYDSDNAAATIARLRRAGAGHPRALAPLTRAIRAQRRPGGRSRAVYWSTRCAFGPRSAAGARHQALAAAPRLAPFLAGALPSACDVWAVPAVATPAPRALLPTPVLVIAGGRDSLVPAGRIARFVHIHAAARLLRVPGAGHAPSLASPCSWRVMARFWHAPSRSPVAACGR